MDSGLILMILKHNIGIKTVLEDEYLITLIYTSIQCIKDYGIKSIGIGTADMELIASYATWKYNQRKKGEAMPRALEYDLHNRLLKECGKNGS